MKKKLEPLSKSEQVYVYVKDLILDNKLKPNERIVISKIAEELEISTIPVREGLRMLASKGYVELMSQRGAKVAKINIEELESIFLIRTELEVLATKLAVQNANKHEIKILHNLCEKMNNEINSNNLEAYTKSNKEFHDLLYSCSKNEILIDLINNLYARSEKSKQIFKYNTKRMKESSEEHLLIVKGVEQGDEHLATTTMRKQKEIGFNIVLNSLKLSQSYTEGLNV